MSLKTGAPPRPDLGGEAAARVEAVVRDIGFPLEPERMYARVLDAALELTGSDAGSLALVDDETHLLNIPMTQGFADSTVRNLKIGVGEGVIGWVVANETPLIVPDTHAEPRFIAGDIDVRSEMAVPLFLGDRVIGALDVNAMRRDSYRGADAAALLAFATLMAPRVQNARLYGETRQRADALHALFEIGKLVSETLDIDKLMERIVEHAVHLMDARIAALTLLSDDGQYLITSAVAGAGHEYAAKPPLRVDHSLIGQAIVTRRPLIVDDVQQDERYQFVHIAQNQGLRALLAVPMMFRDKVLGVISIYKGHLHAFKSEEIGITTSLADQAAIAIRNAMLYDGMMNLETQVQRLERIGTAGEIAVGFAHEVRNPLTVIKMLLDSVADLTLEDREVIKAEVDRMGAIIEQHLKFARPHELALEPLAPHTVVASSLHLLEHRLMRQGIEVETDYTAGTALILGSESHLEQVFVNLFLNAMDAMPQGGVLRATVAVDGDEALATVEDTGPGIPEHIRKRLFEPFNTSKEAGMGIGLSIVQRIVRDHNGHIDVRTGEGEGTRFTIRFPLATNEEGDPT
jgi:two-component system, NtrC family, sensor histidine kinase HydH